MNVVIKVSIMNKLLMSIHPKYASKILNGTKKVEFRTKKCQRDISTIIIYSTSPICAVVGEAKVSEIIVDSPENIWLKMNKVAGLDKDKFDLYFNGRSEAIAYVFGEVKKYTKPIALSEIGVKYAPRSFVYI